MKYTLFLCLCLLARLQLQAQQEKLHVGDTMPEFMLHNVRGYPSGTLRVADLSGKLVILDFWNTWCAPCIRSLPKLDSLQRRFQGQLFVLPVTFQPMDDVARFWVKNPVTKTITLPTVTSDTLLTAAFGDYQLPSVVWIDGDGVIRAVTGHDDVNERNILAMLDGRPFDHVSVAKRAVFDFAAPLVGRLESQVGGGAITHCYAFSKHLLAYSADVHRQDEAGVTRITLINQRIGTLYYYVLHQLMKGRYRYRTLWRVAQPERIAYSPAYGQSDRWHVDNTYCYDASFPAELTDAQVGQRMIEDFNAYFRLDARLEELETTCWVLMRPDGVGSFPVSPDSLTAAEVAYKLEGVYDELPVVNGLPDGERISLFGNKLTNLSLAELQALLWQQGLRLERATRSIRMLVVDDRP